MIAAEQPFYTNAYSYYYSNIDLNLNVYIVYMHNIFLLILYGLRFKRIIIFMNSDFNFKQINKSDTC